MGTNEEIWSILQKAYQIEVDGYTFYRMTADKAEKPAVKELFEKLAHDEVEHQAYLKNVMKNVREKGTHAFAVQTKPVDLSAFSQAVFTDRFREQAHGAAFEVGVLSVGMTLENNAVAHFRAASEGTGEKEVKAFYQFLAEWERQHFEALQNLYNSVRMDFWQGAGFAAF